MAEQSGPELALGIDIGGSGIKGAPVDLTTGEFAAERQRIPTPHKSTPEAVTDVVAELVDGFDLPDDAPVGVAFPAPLDHGVVRFIANLHKSWKGADLPALLQEATGRSVTAVNDADAAGVGEDRYGAAQGRDGVVLVVTLGTGIGSALLVDGVLVPNTELGHLEIDGHDAESRAAESARDRDDLSWEKWAKRLQRYFETVEMLLSPDLIVVGGGVSKHHQKFLPLLDLRAEIIPATLRNRAGIVGAASLAARPH
ncbi:ROK family protein [Isoptericola chiayiensis]|uniref:ROK family protein n=1 Tax=Isoptericola chiayiensis TaxID=579446 RepID=A0ABP8YHX1_9MICO|nr:ROK family protein [Isoptericola chiayiensis]NOW00270.1 polyphosphate glucokinase [Isoptericola chiayiensis]